eukprot:scaffold7052_cov254-Pinguiococcus_pyrenoidosus.AAC.80
MEIFVLMREAPEASRSESRSRPPCGKPSIAVPMLLHATLQHQRLSYRIYTVTDQVLHRRSGGFRLGRFAGLARLARHLRGGGLGLPKVHHLVQKGAQLRHDRPQGAWQLVPSGLCGLLRSFPRAEGLPPTVAFQAPQLFGPVKRPEERRPASSVFPCDPRCDGTRAVPALQQLQEHPQCVNPDLLDRTRRRATLHFREEVRSAHLRAQQHRKLDQEPLPALRLPERTGAMPQHR